MLHVHTTKGRGYEPAELDEEKCLHDVGPFDPETGVALCGAGRAAELHRGVRLGARCARRRLHPEIVAITAAMAGPTGLIAFRDRYPERFFDVGIAEQHAVNAAAGMAMGGLRPVVAIYSTFLNRAWDQVYYDVGLHRLPVIFCLDRAGITGDDGPSHHGVLDMMLLTKVPGMTVFAPSSYEEVGNMLHEALAITTGPVAIRWPKSEARSAAAVGQRDPGAKGPHRVPGLPHRRRQARGRLRAGRRHARRRRRRGHRVGRPPRRPARPGDDRGRPRPWPRRVGRGRDRRRWRRDGGSSAALRARAPPAAAARRGQLRRADGLSSPTATPPDILARLGLDGPGITRVVLEHL